MPVQTSVITGTQAHKHSATGGSSDGGKLEVGGAGGDTSFDLSQGSVMYSNGTSLVELIKPVTPAGEVLTFATSATQPSWATAGGVSLNLSTNETTSQQSSTSTSFIDITNTNVTLSGTGSGNAICSFDSFMQAGEGIIARWSFSTDGDQTEQHFNSSVPEKFQRTLTGITSTLNSQTVKVQAKNSSSSTMYFAVDTSGVTRVYVLEIS